MQFAMPADSVDMHVAAADQTPLAMHVPAVEPHRIERAAGTQTVESHAGIAGAAAVRRPVLIRAVGHMPVNHRDIAHCATLAAAMSLRCDDCAATPF